MVLPTLTYASETLVWNEAQKSRIQAAEKSYLRGACGVTRWTERAMKVYRRFGMSYKGREKKCGVVEVKRKTPRWFGHLERMDEGDTRLGPKGHLVKTGRLPIVEKVR